jgi:tetratricopeptide (TPR) repeat protein
MGWLGVIALALYLLRVAPRRGMVFIVLAVVTVAANVAVAEDLSRSASVIVPAALLGLILPPSSTLFGNPRVAIGAAILNLLLPAAHVIDDHKIPILYLQAELDRNQDPLAEFNARFYESRAVSYAMTGRDQLALEMLDVALKIRPDFAEAMSNRSLLQAKLGDLRTAIADADRALEIDPTVPDIWLNRAEIRMSCGDVHGAASDIEQSIKRSHADWPRLGEASAALGKIRGVSYP